MLATAYHGKNKILVDFVYILFLIRLNYKLKGMPHQRTKLVSFEVNPTNEKYEVDTWPPATSDLTLYLYTEGMTSVGIASSYNSTDRSFL